ncbi:MAG: hydrogenase [Crocinitomicaceae bacterium]|nr:hydrogenase [Crocinitomicaceae bacterium]|tara:strand:- start:12151 stop:13062 length:912 start_codon:yes stop_codon:yes gene_type:complete
MIIKFSDNRIKQIYGIVKNNYKAILIFFAIDFVVYLAHVRFGINFHVPAIPVSIMGGALAIFLAFRNNSAYDRWWEARKIWGAIVNHSRTFAAEILAIVGKNEQSKEIVYRHLAWLHGLKLQLRKQEDFSEAKSFLNQAEVDEFPSWKNKASQLLRVQSEQIAKLKRENKISDFEQKQFFETIKQLYDCQGKAERIKSTVFPYYYTYFTDLFLWTFIVFLPMIIVDEMGWQVIPMSMAVSFVFYILDKTGLVTEDPFENRAADTPMSTISRTIEIDLKQMLGEENLPEPYPIEYTSYRAKYRM